MILLNKYINGRVPYVQEIKKNFLRGPILKSLLNLFHQKVNKSWNNLIEVILTTDCFHEDTLKSQDY